MIRLTIAAVTAVGIIGVCHPVSQADTRDPLSAIESYAPVYVDDYVIKLPNPGRSSPITGVYFLTPDGIPCALAAGGGGIAGSAGCIAEHLPGLRDQGPFTSIDTGNGVRASWSTSYIDNAVQGHKLKPLPPFHSITVGGNICGVDNGGMTACKDSRGGRGFVMSPARSGWIPRI